MTQKQNGTSKADFVRSMPKTMTPAEIIEEGKKAGVTISAQNVHATRYQDKANGHKSKPAAKKATKKAAKKLSKVKAVTVKKNGNGKTPEHVLAKYPNMKRAPESFDGSALATQLVTSLREMVRQSVRDEVRSMMSGVFQA